MLTDGESTDPKVLHPIAIQIKQIERLKAALGIDFWRIAASITSLIYAENLYRCIRCRPQIYVHSKICVVDDEYATIGSAHIHGR